MHAGPSNWLVACTLDGLAAAQRAVGCWQQERELLERALSTLEGETGHEHSVVALLINLGAAYGAGFGKPGDSRRQRCLLERALAIQERLYGREHAELKPVLVKLAAVYAADGDVHLAHEMHERAGRLCGVDRLPDAQPLVSRDRSRSRDRLRM
eukprot:gnl/TRDRNA2_/TRDRNA2_38972_c0_seq1.p1 gnl/TRDRNA2_/TRDRNA2_38972_c0~~gnl/TRDRNA2_/TRDRNA2_38972_c0_seq1.p1  ORF type:complete len:154 (+),score=18.33 gnl/TRDRNA2_/TRDRNA2_38972_c0_seq1:79-540(+)